MQKSSLESKKNRYFTLQSVVTNSNNIASPAPAQPMGRPFITLSQLAGIVAGVLHDALAAQRYWVLADVTNYSGNPAKGYHFCELLEKESENGAITARMAAKMWGKAADRLLEFERITGVAFGSGIKVLLQVSIQFHPTYGLQLNIHQIDATYTLGVLARQKEITLARLATECASFVSFDGSRYHTRNSQLRLPVVLQRLALVTSRHSAGCEDVLHTLHQNAPGFQFHTDIYHTAVQGEHNAGDVVAALVDVYRSGIAYDAVLVIRGGGSESDLIIYDAFEIGRAVAKFPFPVITGIGHQRNLTIADQMAHTHTKTPTQAAEYIIGHNKAFEDRVGQLRQRISLQAQRKHNDARNQLIALHHNLVQVAGWHYSRQHNVLSQVHSSLQLRVTFCLHTAGARLRTLEGTVTAGTSWLLPASQVQLSDLQKQLQKTLRSFLQHQQLKLTKEAAVARLLSPERILARGFAIVRQRGNVIADGAGLKTGDELEVIFAQTSILTQIKSIKHHDSGTENL